VPAGRLEQRSLLMAEVVPLLRLRHLGDRRFDYLVPDELREHLRAGSLVEVPFGRRRVRGVVLSLHPVGVAPEAVELRHIEGVSEAGLPEELLELAGSLSRRYLASIESCLRLMVPPTDSFGTGKRAARQETWVVRLSAKQAGSDWSAASDALTPKQKQLLKSVPEGGNWAAAICATAGVSRSVLQALARKGLIGVTERSRLDSVEPEVSLPTAEESSMPELWPDQAEAVARLESEYDAPGLSSQLLWGVTASGKTEIYLRLIAHALDDGAGAILMVPEIALTSQMISRVTDRFGSRVAVIHSGLPRARRRADYRRVLEGTADIVVGTRSAIFAPLKRLRLVIIDESHDGSYKQEEEPRYAAGTVAEMRLREGGGLLLEGTATPSLESVHLHSSPVRLFRRASGRTPSCEAVDMRRQGGEAALAAVSREALAGTMRDGGQAIILLNRRGYAGHVYCDLCGHVMLCRDCELSLTYHSGTARLVCHHCGLQYVEPPICPSCGLSPMSRARPGTERVDKEVRSLVRDDQVFRLDSDVLTSGARAREVLRNFETTRPSVLVGTQMVAKGHDFPDVALVIVADADTGLYIPDFRASERTFQLLTQVSGRAGRSDRPGRVLVQTWNPSVPCIRMALEGDEQGFYEQELKLRQRVGYPPFRELVKLTMVAADARRAEMAARYLSERLSQHFPASDLRGPVRLSSLKGRERWQLVLASEDGARVRSIAGQGLSQLEEPYRIRGVTLLVDVDPQSFM